MKIIRSLVALFFSVLLVVSSVSCAPRTLVASTNTPEPTLSFTATPTVTPTAIPTAVPTPAVDEYGFTEERRAELNQQFQDFLNYEGDFTPEKITSAMMELDRGIDQTTLFDMSSARLGVSSLDPYLQGYFFDYFKKNDRAILLFGFDGEDSNRFITPVEMPYYLLEAIDTAAFVFVKNPVNSIELMDYSTGNVGFFDYLEFTFCKDINTLIYQLNLLKGNIISFRLEESEIDVSVLNEMNLDEKNYNAAVEYIIESNSKIGLSYGLMELMTSNNFDYKKYKGENSNSDSPSIIRIKDIKNIYCIDIAKVPIATEIVFFEGIIK